MMEAVESPGKIALNQVTTKAREDSLRRAALEFANAHDEKEKAGDTIRRAEAYLKFLKGSE